MTGGEKQIC